MPQTPCLERTEDARGQGGEATNGTRGGQMDTTSAASAAASPATARIPPLWISDLDEDCEDPIPGVIRVDDTDYDTIFSHEPEIGQVFITVVIAIRLYVDPAVAALSLLPLAAEITIYWNWTPECEGLLRVDGVAPVRSGTQLITLEREALVQEIGCVLADDRLWDFLERQGARSCGRPYFPWNALNPT